MNRPAQRNRSFFSTELCPTNLISNSFPSLQQPAAWLESHAQDAYYGAFFILLMRQLIKSTTWIDTDAFIWLKALVPLLVPFVLILLIWKLFTQQYTFKYIIVDFLLIGVASGIAICSSTRNFIWIVLFLIAYQNIDIHHLAKILFMTVLATILLSLLASLLGIIPNYALAAIGEREVRYSLGTAHPNSFGALCLISCIALGTWTQYRWRIRIILYTLVAVLPVYFVANSRTAAAIMLFFAFCVALLPIIKSHQSSFYIFVFCFALLVVIGSIILAAVYNPSNPVMAQVDQILSGRISLANRYLYMQSLTPLGSSFENAPSVAHNLRGDDITLLVDNAYVNILLVYGWISLTLYVSALILAARKFAFLKQWNLCIFAFFFMAIVGIFETYPMLFQLNPYLLIFAPLIDATKDRRLRISRHGNDTNVVLCSSEDEDSAGR